MTALLTEVRVRGFRSLVDVTLRPGEITALVGEARSGKSNLLAAIRALLDPAAPMPVAADLSVEGEGRIHLEASLDGGGRVSLAGIPPRRDDSREDGPPVVFVPAALRSGRLVAGHPAGPGASATRRISSAVRDAGSNARGASDAAFAGALVRGIESCLEGGVGGTVFLVEEPELFLRPHTQRYLYRLLRELASAGNQVLFSTHAPAFLNVARLEEFALLERPAQGSTRIRQPAPLDPSEAFRVMSEFDAERGELFLSRVAVLVEGRTEQLVLPFVFLALGHDVDREAVSIVECGGKSNLPLFVEVCRAVGVPYVVVHDRDAPAGARPSTAERALNALIARSAGRERTIVLEPDFEGVAGLRGNRRKPERAWTRFRSLTADSVPAPLRRVVEIATSLDGTR
jgi:hypothetical protein